MSLPTFFKCGCSIVDEATAWSPSEKMVFRKCKKHQKEMKRCSWMEWAKTNAPAQYKKYKRDIS